MISRFRIPILIVVALLGALLWWRVFVQGPKMGGLDPAPHRAPNAQSGTAPGQLARPATGSEAESLSKAALLKLFASIPPWLGQGPERSLWALRDLRARLEAADRDEAVAAILEFLESGADAETGLPFAVGAGGMLASAPTLRVFLMGELGSLDASGDSALRASLRVLQDRRSPDEWAIALRNIAWADPSARDLLSGRFRELIDYKPWQTNPSGGFLESFDVVVFLKDVTFVEPLAEFVESGDARLGRAAAVALDRLSELAPGEVMAALNAEPDLLAQRPFLRADYFAKADLSNPAQLQLVEAYLARADVDRGEKAKFVAQLPVPGQFISDNLLTKPLPPEDPARRDAAIYKAANEWLKAGKYTMLTAEIAALVRRLNVGQ